MPLRYDYAAIVALSSAAAVLTALSDYALSMEKSLDAVSLRMVAAFFITALAWWQHAGWAAPRQPKDARRPPRMIANACLYRLPIVNVMLLLIRWS